MNRRQFLATLPLALAKAADAPVRAITGGPKYHWFGYYDKFQFDQTSRFVLSNQVDFEHRSPVADDVIQIGMVDTHDKDHWIELGQSRAWNWQQGCMLQWVPGARNSRDQEIVWNDRVDNQFVAHVMNVRTRRTRTLPAPVYNISPDGKWAIYPDFRRLNQTRPGYGYAGIPDPNENNLAPEDAGLWRMNMQTGKRELLISFAQAAAIPNLHSPWEPTAKHWFNHLLFSPDGSRFIFLHRWRGPKQGPGFGTRMFTATVDGKDLHVLDPYGGTSHFIWRDPTHVLAWAKHPSHGEKFYLYEDRTDKVEVVGKDVMTVNGHCTYLPGNKWILNDSYPQKDNKQQLYLYEIASGKRTELGAFSSEPPYRGEYRCDLHPRSSPDGKKICIDSAHNNGRQLYLLDLNA